MNKRQDFTILQDPLQTYLDHAASSLTPDCVVDAMVAYYQEYRSNVHRGLYSWSSQATQSYERARQIVAGFVGADSQEVVFTSGTTAGINLVAEAYLKHQIKPNQHILITPLEHHANMIPWQRLAKAHQCTLSYIPLNDDFSIDFESLSDMVAQHDIALIAMTHASNVIGVSYDIKQVSQLGIPVLVDGTQMVSHEPVDVTDLGCAFYAWSAHKMYGPTGIGALYINSKYHQKIQPHFTGGGIVENVSYDTATFQPGIHKLEPGTPNISGAIGFAKACDYMTSIGFEKIMAHEQQVWNDLIDKLKPFNLQTFGPQQHYVYSFTFPSVHAHDVSEILASDQVMIRAGHHCCMPLMKRLGVGALARVSLGLYNQSSDIDHLVNALTKVSKVMQL
ncbi:MAG: cysteine desulfurase [Pseudomonadota bacterium]|nr:cysteine desulfurase [Pseudomonadota bacterium]